MLHLNVPVPPMLERALGYESDARLVGFYWMPAGDEAMYDDGRISGTGHWDAYLTYVRHPAVRFALAGYDFGSSDYDATHWLILDRETRRLHVATVDEARRLLRGQWPPVEPVHLTKEQWHQINEALRDMMLQPIDHDALMRATSEHRRIVAELAAWLSRAGRQ